MSSYWPTESGLIRVWSCNSYTAITSNIPAPSSMPQFCRAIYSSGVPPFLGPTCFISGSCTNHITSQLHTSQQSLIVSVAGSKLVSSPLFLFQPGVKVDGIKIGALKMQFVCIIFHIWWISAENLKPCAITFKSVIRHVRTKVAQVCLAIFSQLSIDNRKTL